MWELIVLRRLLDSLESSSNRGKLVVYFGVGVGYETNIGTICVWCPE